MLSNTKHISKNLQNKIIKYSQIYILSIQFSDIFNELYPKSIKNNLIDNDEYNKFVKANED